MASLQGDACAIGGQFRRDGALRKGLGAAFGPLSPVERIPSPCGDQAETQDSHDQHRLQDGSNVEFQSRASRFFSHVSTSRQIAAAAAVVARSTVACRTRGD